MNQQIMDQMAARQIERQKNLEKYTDALLTAKLINLTPKTYTSRMGVRAAAVQEVPISSSSEFFSKYKQVPSGTRLVVPTDLELKVSGQFVLRDGVDWRGGYVTGSRNPTGGSWVNKNAWLIIVPSGVGNFDIQSRFKTNIGLVYFEGGHPNVRFSGCRFQFGQQRDAYNGHAFWSGNGVQLDLVGSHFHDSLLSNRNLEIWGWDGEYADNTCWEVNDGGHVMNPNPNWKMLRNRWERLHRMGIEIQQNSYPAGFTAGVEVGDNVLFNWYKPYWDSMGLSVPIAGTGVRIYGNFIDHRPYDRTGSSEGTFGDPESSGTQRGSYGIEAANGRGGADGNSPCIVEGNTFISGRSVACVATPGIGTIARNNKHYGNFAWGEYITEPGSGGPSSIITSNNQKLSSIPPVPGVDPDPDPDPTPTPEPDMLPSVTGKAYTTFAEIQIPAGSPVGGAVLERRTKETDTNGKLKWTSISVYSGKAEKILDQFKGYLDTIPPKNITNWEFWYRLRDSVASGPEFKIQMGQNADPGGSTDGTYPSKVSMDLSGVKIDVPITVEIKDGKATVTTR